ncbi:hypothetical protein A2961_03820 [Candidatus Woesebacteria bacterium RIFCSPLOWO2_01_FULL_39_21]|uniref:Uncharacterized protein n=1 Tax=Candidatus Woesebacteria bacterium RIFCSPLOWO2_01_FULL_39_21 TaxID=1802519 RepID=A0A1F8BC60_9BACT|nr:MAG: hypothetical protein A2961_03820 [Candidatus Woesebacteria bacterium RIFCSPLOWO2_01_FULL_39_21]
MYERPDLKVHGGLTQITFSTEGDKRGSSEPAVIKINPGPITPGGRGMEFSSTPLREQIREIREKLSH